MYRYILSAVCCLCLVHAQNLLQNPGFEVWKSGMPDYWHADDGIGILQEQVIKHGGTSCVKESLVTQNQSNADLYQTIAVQPNSYYTFSVWVRDSDTSGRLGIGIEWYPSGFYWPSVYSVDSNDWQELSFISAPSPSNAESATVYVRGYDILSHWDGDAVFYVDDAAFAVLALQPPVIVRSWHKPTQPEPNAPVDVYSVVSDDGSIVADTLYYSVNNPSYWGRLLHQAVSHDTFTYNIPGQSAHDTVFYFLKYTDDDGLETISDTYAYYVGTINVFLNELYYDSPGLDSGCFVELFGPGLMSLDHFTVVGIDGNDGSEYATIDLTGYAIPQDGFFVIAQDSTVPYFDVISSAANPQNGPDNVHLRYCNITVDALGYGELNGWFFSGEWVPAPDVSEGHALGRCPDGYDSDNNAYDFSDYPSCTPGYSNMAVSIEEHGRLTLPTIANPVHSGIVCSSLIDDVRYYPICVYSTIGQVVARVENPTSALHVPCGVYFITSKKKGVRFKIVVVK